MVEVIMFGANRVGEQIYEWLLDDDDTDVLALVTNETQYETVQRLEPDLIVSAGFRHVVPEWVLDIPERGINCHLGYLPYNRGMNPNVWSIVEDTPAGVAIHRMSPDVDGGPLLGRRSVEKQLDDDGKDVYERLERAMLELFVETWPEIRDGSVSESPQDPDAGTYHYKSEFVELCEIDCDETVRVGDLLDRLRALSFEPYNNAYVTEDGDRYYLDLTITHEDDIESDDVHWNIPEYDT